MRYSSKSSVEYDLQSHYKLRAEYEDKISSLSDYRGCRLKTSTSNSGNLLYSIRYEGESNYKYLGVDGKDDISKAKEYAYYEKLLSVIKRNIIAMEQFLSVYRVTHAETINDLLKKAYQIPPSDLYLFSEPEVDKWLKDMHGTKSNFPINDAAALKVKAFDGTLLRSRAEAIHYEAFYIYNIPTIFELPYKIGDYIYRPDFTTLYVYTMKPIIWEHLGNWFHENEHKRNSYRLESIHRWDEYSRIGFLPENNLMLTFGSNENIFDIQSLHRKIASFAAPPPSPETIEMLKRS